MASRMFQQTPENIGVLGNRLTVDQRTLTPSSKPYKNSLLASPKLSNSKPHINGLGGFLSNAAALAYTILSWLLYPFPMKRYEMKIRSINAQWRRG